MPYQTIGSVPIPTCALNATEKLASWLIDSAITADVTLSISSPPYASGTSTAINPRSPALRSRLRIRSKFFASIWSATGITSLVVNSAAVFRDLPLLFGEILRCEHLIGRALLGEKAAPLHCFCHHWRLRSSHVVASLLIPVLEFRQLPSRRPHTS